MYQMPNTQLWNTELKLKHQNTKLAKLVDKYA